jgi:hypothetical protein
MMSELGWQRLRGLQAMIEDVVEHGSAAVERIHRETVRRPYAIAAAIPTVGTHARAAHAVHDAALAGVYMAVRLVNQLLGRVLGAALGTSGARGAAR